MKKIVLTLAAIAALSTTALANPNRSWTPLDEQYKDTNSFASVIVEGDAAAFAVAGDEVSGSSNFDRLTKRMIEQDISHN